MKVAISLPDPLFAAGERFAGERGLSRSQLYSDALAEYLRTRAASAVTEQLDAVYAVQAVALDPALARAQIRGLDDEAW